MRVFTTVVDSGGFTAASEKLPISRAGVSKHVAELESSLGGRLLNRTTRRISLTQAGRAYYEKCQQILEAVADADCLVSGMTSNPAGILRINAPMSFGNRWLGPLLTLFSQSYPEVELDVTLSDRQVDMIEEGYDLTIRITRPKDSSLVARRLVPCRFMVAASPDYLNQHGTPTSPEDLTDHHCLMYSYRPNPERWVFDRQGEMVEVRVKGPMTTNAGELLCSAGANGMGIVLLPTFIVYDQVQSGQLIPILNDCALREAGIYVVYPSNRLITEKVRRFSEFSAEYFNLDPEWDRYLSTNN